MTLYEITASMATIMEALEQDAMFGEDEQIMMDTFEGLDGDFEAKAEAYAMVIRNFEAEAKALKEEEKRLYDRRKTAENNISRMKRTLQGAMTMTGKRDFARGVFKFKIKQNSGLAPLVLDCEVEKLPQEFQKVVVTADNDKLRNYIKENKDCKYAHLGERGESLSIK